MALYTVLTPCVVGTLHYARVPAGPIEVDPANAAALVDSGALAPADPTPDAASPQPAAHRRRAAKED